MRQLLALTDREIAHKQEEELQKRQTSPETEKTGTSGYGTDIDWQRDLMNRWREEQKEKALGREIRQQEYEKQDQKYKDLLSAAKKRDDFEKLTSYKSTANGHKFDGSVHAGYGWDDMLYEYVNKNEDAVRIADEYGDFSFMPDVVVGNDKTFLQQMSDDEVKTFNYIDKTEGRDAYVMFKHLEEI